MKKNLIVIAAVFALLSCKKKESETEVNYSQMPQELAFTKLTTIGNVDVRNGGFGSGASKHPTNKNEFYLITDRGANIDYLSGKKFLTPSYTPTIGHFRIKEDGTIEVVRYIKLKNPLGTPITGLPNPAGKGATGEVAYDMAGNVLFTDDYGLDSESIVAASDGTFWVSDEYGPHIVHYNADGVEMERISPTNVNTGGAKFLPYLKKEKLTEVWKVCALHPTEKLWYV